MLRVSYAGQAEVREKNCGTVYERILTLIRGLTVISRLFLRNIQPAGRLEACIKMCEHKQVCVGPF